MAPPVPENKQCEGQMASEESQQKAKTGHWEEYYAKDELKREPSSFASHVVNRNYVKAGDKLVDIGCGNGRDALHFASEGVETLGLDASQAAIRILTAKQAENATFKAMDIKDEEFLALRGFSHFYMRFFLHAITPQEEARVFQVLSNADSGARVIAEFRTVNDPLMQKGEVVSENERIHGHYRRFLDLDKVIGRLRDIGFSRVLLKSEEGNLSVEGDDNPVLARIIADKV